jgi:hypothetical protein
MKTCRKCGLELPLTMFVKHPTTADKRQNHCKPCRNAWAREYLKDISSDIAKKYKQTKTGFLVRLYRNMKSRISGVQKAKFHLYKGKELLPRQEFYDWASSCEDFHRLFAQYEQSGFDRQKAPSVDRIDTNHGYLISNMRWMTHKENSALGGLHNAAIKKRRVSQYDLTGNYIATYQSITEAARKSGCDISAISTVINGKARLTKGFIWKSV